MDYDGEDGMNGDDDDGDMNGNGNGIHENGTIQEEVAA